MLLLSIIMILGSLWIGSYFYRHVKGTWAELPYVVTFICNGIVWFTVGFFTYVNSLLP